MSRFRPAVRSGGADPLLPRWQAMTSQMEKMLAGELYDSSDPEIAAAAQAAARWLRAYNRLGARPVGERLESLRAGLAEVGEGSEIRPPFHCDYGFNLHLGSRVFLNFGCVILDVVAVRIGDGTKIGPHVSILAADHPRDPDVRRRGLESGRPVEIGPNVWIGAGALILPGIRIGEDAIIGAGAVVTRDVGRAVTVAGNPARPIEGRGPARLRSTSGT